MLQGTEIIRTSTSPSARLAADLARFIHRFVYLTGRLRALLAIWIMHTHVFDDYEFTPYLNIQSPEPACGKSTVAGALSALCSRSTSPTCGTAAFLRRKIDAVQPTLIVDEYDTLDDSVRTAFANSLNSGFRFDGTYSYVSGAEIVELKTFCPKAILGRSAVQLAEATKSRCITFVIHKARPEERLEKFRRAGREEAALLRKRCEAWAADFRNRPVKVDPAMPSSFNARQQDIAEVLLAIGEDCGGPWPRVVQNALAELFTEAQVPHPENELLRAVHRFFGERGTDHFWSNDFCTWANQQPERPWSENPLTPAKLAQMLKHYEVYPDQINRIINGKQCNSRGYRASQFQDVFARYVGAPAIDPK